MKYFITAIIILLLFTAHKLLAQEEITDADLHYTVLTAYEDHVLNQISANITYKYIWEGDQTDYKVRMSAHVN